MSIPPRTGKIETVTINEFLESLDMEVGTDIIMGDFDILGWHLASKVRNSDTENYKKFGAIFRPNYERGMLMHSLIRKKGLFNILEIGFGRGYVTACSALAIYGMGVSGSVTTVDVAHNDETLRVLNDVLENSVSTMVNIQPVQSTSDEFFENLSEDKKFDIIFIDGDHRYDYVKRDFENAIKHIDRGYIVMDDYHMPSKVDKDIEVANFVDTLPESYSRKLVKTDRLIFADDQKRTADTLEYGMVLLPIGDIDDE